jgi:hypothetical protein
MKRTLNPIFITSDAFRLGPNLRNRRLDRAPATQETLIDHHIFGAAEHLRHQSLFPSVSHWLRYELGAGRRIFPAPRRPTTAIPFTAELLGVVAMQQTLP